jgi:anti-sigma B factor antagonist
MEIKVEDHEKFWKVCIDGRLVAACVEDLKDALAGKVEAKPQVLFDLSKMTHVDSSGLGALVQVLQKAKAGGGIARLACLQPHPRIVIDITKVFRVFEIFDTVEQAEKAFA